MHKIQNVSNLPQVSNRPSSVYAVKEKVNLNLKLYPPACQGCHSPEYKRITYLKFFVSQRGKGEDRPSSDRTIYHLRRGGVPVELTAENSIYVFTLQYLNRIINVI